MSTGSSTTATTPTKTRHLWVGGLPEGMDEDSIQEYFTKFGKVEGVKILPQRYPNSGMAAFVDFHRLEDAVAAYTSDIKIQGVEVRTNYKSKIDREHSKRYYNSPEREGNEEDKKKIRKKTNSSSSQSSSGDTSSSDSEGEEVTTSSSSSNESEDKEQQQTKKTSTKATAKDSPTAAASSSSSMCSSLMLKVTNLAQHKPEAMVHEALYYKFYDYSAKPEVRLYEEDEKRYALVKFRNLKESRAAFREAQGVSLFGNKLRIAPFSKEDFPSGGRDLPYPPPVPPHAGTSSKGTSLGFNRGNPFLTPDELDPNATRSLFVGNIPKNISIYELRDVFQRYGHILDVEIKKMSGNATYGFVLFFYLLNAINAKRAMDGAHLGGNKIRVGYGKGTPGRVLWIDGIDISLSETQLETYFSKYGTVVRLGVDRSTYTAMVQFETMDEAKDALGGIKGGFIGNSRSKIMADFANRDAKAAFFTRIENIGGRPPYPMYPGDPTSLMRPLPLMPGMPPHMDYYGYHYPMEPNYFGYSPYPGTRPPGFPRPYDHHGYSGGGGDFEDDLREFSRRRERERQKDRNEQKKRKRSPRERSSSESEHSTERRKENKLKKKRQLSTSSKSDESLNSSSLSNKKERKRKRSDNGNESKKERRKEDTSKSIYDRSKSVDDRKRKDGEKDQKRKEDKEKKEKEKERKEKKEFDESKLKEKESDNNLIKQEEVTLKKEETEEEKEIKEEIRVEEKDKNEIEGKTRETKDDKIAEDKEITENDNIMKEEQTDNTPYDNFSSNREEESPTTSGQPVAAVTREKPKVLITYEEEDEEELRTLPLLEEDDVTMETLPVIEHVPAVEEPVMMNYPTENIEVREEEEKEEEEKAQIDDSLLLESADNRPKISMVWKEREHPLKRLPTTTTAATGSGGGVEGGAKIGKSEIESDFSSGEEFDHIEEEEEEKEEHQSVANKSSITSSNDTNNKPNKSSSTSSHHRQRKTSDSNSNHYKRQNKRESIERRDNRRDLYDREKERRHTQQRNLDIHVERRGSHRHDDRRTHRRSPSPRRLRPHEQNERNSRRRLPSSPSRHGNSPNPRRRHSRSPRPRNQAPHKLRRSRSPSPLRRRHMTSRSPTSPISRHRSPRPFTPPTSRQRRYSPLHPRSSKSPKRRSPRPLTPPMSRSRRSLTPPPRSRKRSPPTQRSSRYRRSPKYSHASPPRRQRSCTPPGKTISETSPNNRQSSEAPPTCNASQNKEDTKWRPINNDSDHEKCPRTPPESPPTSKITKEDEGPSDIIQSHPSPSPTTPTKEESPPQADFVDLLQKYPVIWQGHLSLKNEVTVLQFHYLSGNDSLAKLSLSQSPSEGGIPNFRISQRMRLEQTQLDGVEKRLQNKTDHCLLLGLPCGLDAQDIQKQTHTLQHSIISYLSNKQAAGIINISIEQTHLSRVAPDLFNVLSDNCHLMILLAVT